ncbi:GFA family protein [Hwanghaeella sp.]|uniref:GFA family protein n=1 Tax=Hwanghaeella sp. TaxID=2605943 RepID=UPI003CCBD62D
MISAKGGCLCGALRYQVQSRPSRVTMCHCRFCQRATGAAYLVEPIFDKADFSLVKGEAKVYRHLSEGSGKWVYVHFCDVCGTKLFLTFDRFKDVVGVYGGTFDDPNWFERSPDNSKHIFLAAAQHGTVIPPGVNTYDEHATTNDGTPIEPHVLSEPMIVSRPP